MTPKTSTPKTNVVPAGEASRRAPDAWVEDTPADTIRDPVGRSPLARSVVPTPRPSPPSSHRWATGIDAGAWDLFLPSRGATPASFAAAPSAPIAKEELASLEVYAKILAAVQRDGATTETLARFGLDALAWAETERAFAARLAASPSLVRALRALVARDRRRDG